MRAKRSSSLTFNVSPNRCEDEISVCTKDRLAQMNADDVVLHANNWLADMEAIRARSSNIQGVFSGKLRTRIEALKVAISVLSSRTNESDYHSFCIKCGAKNISAIPALTREK